MLPDVIAAITADAMALAKLPGSSLAAVAIGSFLRRRDEQARDILFEELRTGSIDPPKVISADDTIAVVYRYLRAAREGAARINLRLLAKAIAGQYRLGHLVADEFLAQADVLATLTRDEIIVIGALYRVYLEQMTEHANNPQLEFENPWTVAKRRLTSNGMDGDVVRTAITMAQRTGLLSVGETMDELGTFRPSPRLIELGKTIDFQDALRREGVEGMI